MNHHASRLRPTTSVRDAYATPAPEIATDTATTLVVEKPKAKRKSAKKKAKR